MTMVEKMEARSGCGDRGMGEDKLNVLKTI